MSISRPRPLLLFATKVVEVTDARPIWKQSVGIPADSGAGGDNRTYSLLTNRFADHTSLYVRVEDERRNTVYATYSLGHVIAFDEPHAESIAKTNFMSCIAPPARLVLCDHRLERTTSLSLDLARNEIASSFQANG